MECLALVPDELVRLRKCALKPSNRENTRSQVREMREDPPIPLPSWCRHKKHEIADFFADRPRIVILLERNAWGKWACSTGFLHDKYLCYSPNSATNASHK